MPSIDPCKRSGEKFWKSARVGLDKRVGAWYDNAGKKSSIGKKTVAHLAGSNAPGHNPF